MSDARTKKLIEVKKKVIKYLNLIIKDGFPVESAYIFGSYARGDFSIDSDIDLLIVSERFIDDWDNSEKYLWRKTRLVDSKIEPIGFSMKEFEDSAILGQRVKSSGIKIL